jgi:AcrR family transcriptional regulator
MSKQITTPKRSDGLQTMARLLEQAKIELENHGSEHFDVDAVLERAKAARSSLYHHFGSKSDLIYEAQLQQITDGLFSDNQLLRTLVELSPSVEDFLALFSGFVRTTADPQFVALRQRRVQVLASATQNPRLAEAIREAQVFGIQYFADTLQILADRGWIDPPLDLLSVSYLLQGMIFGHIILDFSVLPEVAPGWAEAAIMTMLHLTGAKVAYLPPT